MFGVLGFIGVLRGGVFGVSGSSSWGFIWCSKDVDFYMIMFLGLKGIIS
jgi:hypothetical protein